MTRRDAIAKIVASAFAGILVAHGDDAIRCVGGPLDGMTIKDGRKDKFSIVVWFSEAMKEEWPKELAFLPENSDEMYSRTIYRRESDHTMKYDRETSHQLPELFWPMARNAACQPIPIFNGAA